MATVNMRGFTIIELMLFLGITGALFAALMIGVNGNITQQHYRDGVQGYATLLQDEFSEVANTRNERDDSVSCAAGAITENSATNEARGTSPCVILGRAIQVTDSGATIRSFSVLGTEPTGQVVSSDIDTLVAYQPKLADSFHTTTTSLDWGLSLKAENGEASSASLLILRSPSSGLIRVFASNSPFPTDLSSYITAANATNVIKNCVKGESGLLPIQSVSIDAKVSGPNGIFLKEVDSQCV